MEAVRGGYSLRQVLTADRSNVHINAPFLDIFGYTRQYEQAILHSLARKLAAARHSPSKLGLCARLAQTFLKEIVFYLA